MAFQLLFHPGSPPFCYGFKMFAVQSCLGSRRGSWDLPARFRLRPAAAGNFGAVTVAVAGTRSGRPADAVGGDALLQFFHVQQNLLVHLVSPPFCFGILFVPILWLIAR